MIRICYEFLFELAMGRAAANLRERIEHRMEHRKGEYEYTKIYVRVRIYEYHKTHKHPSPLGRVSKAREPIVA